VRYHFDLRVRAPEGFLQVLDVVEDGLPLLFARDTDLKD
jgi:hypothetical protein